MPGVGVEYIRRAQQVQMGIELAVGHVIVREGAGVSHLVSGSQAASPSRLVPSVGSSASAIMLGAVDPQMAAAQTSAYGRSRLRGTLFGVMVMIS